MASIDCFNPLTGIRSFLTVHMYQKIREYRKMFQSPHGDSFFSDANQFESLDPVTKAFQSPHGDSFFSDLHILVDAEGHRVMIEFQSPHGDSFFSDT